MTRPSPDPLHQLERGYRRLLGLYPRRYRRTHGDEMLAVLLTAAPEGKRRPSLRDAADMTGSAIRVWCQPTRRLRWSGALVLIGAAAATGAVGGVSVAAADHRPAICESLIVFRNSYKPSSEAWATAYRQAEIARSQPVLAAAQHEVGPAISLPALRPEIQAVPITDLILRLSVQAPTAAMARTTVNAVARSYVTYVGERFPSAARPLVMSWGIVLPRPTLRTRVTAGAEFGAGGGAILGAIIAVTASRASRRLRPT